MRILRIYHSAVVDEYRQRERMLRVRHGHDLEVVCPPAWPEGGRRVSPTPDPDIPLDVVPIRGPLQPNLFWYGVRNLGRILRRFDPDIVDLHEEPFSLAAGSVLLAMSLTRSQARLCVYSAQNLPKRYPFPFSSIEARALRIAGAAYPCSTEAADRLRSRGFAGDVRVLPLGVTIPPALVARSASPLRVGFVGRLEPYKGGRLALRAFAAAASGTDVVMEVVGGGSEEQALRLEAAAAGIADRVTFTGAVPQAEALRRIATMDVILVPSLTTKRWKEQFGRVPAQAMAHGAVVIASDSGSLAEVVADAGVLVTEGDQDALSAALIRLLAEPARLAALRMKGRERAERLFSWESISDQMDAMYRELAAS